MKKISAFTLLETLVSLSIVVALSAYLLPSLNEIIISQQAKSEDQFLDSLRADIVRSFESDDYANTNIASLSGEVQTGTALTVFSSSTNPVYASTSSSDWFAKLASLRGFSYNASAPTQNGQPVLYSLLFNRYGRSRMLFVGPTEAGIQRFYLLSLMAPSERLSMPAYDNSAAFFNALWNTEWDNRSGSIPSYWSGKLTAAEAARWAGSLPRMRGIKITLNKYKLNISNGHAAYNAYVYWNGASSSSPTGRLVALAGSGVSISPDILGLRTVRVLLGLTEATATEDRRIQVRSNADVVIQ